MTTMNQRKPIELPARFASQPRVHPPTPELVRALRLKAKLTQAQAALLMYVTPDTWRQWEKDRSQSNARGMTAATWELFQLKVGELDCSLYQPRRLEFGRASAPASSPAALFKRAAS